MLQPVAAAAIFSLFLGRLAGLPSDGFPYLPFVFAGLIPWLYVSTAVTAAARSLVDQRPMVTKVYFPRLLAPIAAVLPGLLDLPISLADHGRDPDRRPTSRPASPLVTLPLWIVAAVLVAAAGRDPAVGRSTRSIETSSSP